MTLRRLAGPVVVAAIAAVSLCGRVTAQERRAPVEYGASCSGLLGLSLSRTSVTYTIRIHEGNFVPPGSGPTTSAGIAPYNTLPEFCRATLSAAPATGVAHRTEVWLPTQTWNGKFHALLTDRRNSSANYREMATIVARGDTTAMLESDGPPAPAAIHEMRVAATGLMTAFYGHGAAWAYWHGCGASARDGLLSAAQFPEDFDGIVAALGASSEGVSRITARARTLLLFDRAADAAALGRVDDTSTRLFVMRDAGQCSAENPHLPVLVTALEDWVERGRAPDRLAISRTDVLCPYPRTASGDPANVVCRQP